MSASLPPEIWTLIAKHAVRRPWSMNMFNPPADDFECVSGFAKASPIFSSIVESLKSANDILVMQSLEGLPGHDVSRYQRINISKFPQLTSLSIRLYLDENPFVALANDIQNLPQSATLYRIDIQSYIGSYGRQLEDVPNGLLLSFHNLTELRFFNLRPSTLNTDESLESRIADFLSGLPCLKLLSLNVYLLTQSTLEIQIQIHRNHECDLPAGQLRTWMKIFANCSDCTPTCNFNFDIEARRREITATRILAQKLPNLAEVRWAKWWKVDRDGNGQRRTTITRERVR